MCHLGEIIPVPRPSDSSTMAAIPKQQPQRRFEPAKHYMRVRLEFEEEEDGGAIQVTPVLFLAVVRAAVRTMFGRAGAEAHTVGVLREDGAPADTAVVWTSFASAVRVRAALSLYAQHDGKRLAARVLASSSHLCALAAPDLV